MSLRQIPIDLHDAYSTFRYLDDTDVPEVVRDEQIDFLSLVNNTTYSLDGVCTNDTSHPLPLSMRINVSARGNITCMDEEGIRIMRGCRGGLYALIRSGGALTSASALLLLAAVTECTVCVTCFT